MQPIEIKPTVLTQASSWLLSLLLTRAGWAKTAIDAVTASRLVSRVLPNLDAPRGVEIAPSQRDGMKADPSWCNATVTFTLTERQRDCIKLCLKETCLKAEVFNGPWTLELLETFGLAEEN